MSNSQDNLKAAFAGESQANRKYLFFAEKADQEGQPAVARLFRAAAEAETVHARNHLQALNGIGTSKANLLVAVNGENYEFTQMYPGFIVQARNDKNPKAEWTFSKANEVEEIHHGLFKGALLDLEAGKKIADQTWYVCQVCGNTVSGSAPDKCPVCGSQKNKFKKIE